MIYSQPDIALAKRLVVWITSCWWLPKISLGNGSTASSIIPQGINFFHLISDSAATSLLTELAESAFTYYNQLYTNEVSMYDLDALAPLSVGINYAGDPVAALNHALSKIQTHQTSPVRGLVCCLIATLLQASPALATKPSIPLEMSVQLAQPDPPIGKSTVFTVIFKPTIKYSRVIISFKSDGVAYLSVKPTKLVFDHPMPYIGHQCQGQLTVRDSGPGTFAVTATAITTSGASESRSLPLYFFASWHGTSTGSASEDTCAREQLERDFKNKRVTQEEYSRIKYELESGGATESN